MSNIPNYNSKDEKGKVFVNDYYLDTKEEVDNLFLRLENGETEEYYFRGLTSARYKLYTSGQRFMIENDIKEGTFEPDKAVEFYANVLNIVRGAQGGVIQKWMDMLGISKVNDIALFSYIQHHGGPTPFLDFTRDPYVALYFAADGGRAVRAENELDLYFSLYQIPKSLAKPFNNRWVEAFNEHSEDAEYMLEFLTWWRQAAILALDDDILKGAFKIQGHIANNLNIINQQGLFLTNVHPGLPLMEFMIQHERTQMRVSEFDIRVASKKFKCHNIHNKQLGYVQEKLASRTPSITRSFIYPSTDDIFASINEMLIQQC